MVQSAMVVKEVQGGARGGGLVCVLMRAKIRETYTIVMLEQEPARGSLEQTIKNVGMKAKGRSMTN